MSGNKISVNDLTQALEHFNGKYQAVEIFADDIVELEGPNIDAAMVDLGDDIQLKFQLANGPYEMIVDKATGVARFMRGEEGSSSTLGGMVLGGAIGGAVAAATSKKGDGWVGGMVLGLLAGAALGAASNDQGPRRVFALRYDPINGQWMPYDGGLVPWLKNNMRDR